ncbi:MAG TPA: glucose-6-phosphate dehydrogenase assembly protein OpcA [Mycobacteriales bacterium]|nr:glucose-6-phosphate dehydrogenase assembly protein OpcA [Mycobacteriales bacterium]
MTTKLEKTSSNAIMAALQAERRKAGAVTFGLVLTFVVVIDPDGEVSVDRAVAAATAASLAHPCRVIVVAPHPEGEAQVDAEVSVGGDLGPGESIVIHLHGPLHEHAETVVLPLLAPDTPVVTWWTGDPAGPAGRQIATLASRRITDTYLAKDPRDALTRLAATYEPGDTDLAWTRDSLWRSMIAAVFDALPGPATGVRITTEHGNPSAALLAAWLQSRTGVSVELVDGPGPAITALEIVAADGASGSITARLSRPDGETATLTRTGQPDRTLPLPIRPLEELLAEELQRLDADAVYAESLAAVGGVGPGTPAS